MTWEQTADVLAKEAARLQKRVDQLEAGIQEALEESYKDIGEGKTISQIFEDLEALVSPAVIKLPEGDPNAGNTPLVITIKEIDADYPTKISEFPKDLINAVWMGLDYSRSPVAKITLQQILNVIQRVFASYGFDCLSMAQLVPPTLEGGGALDEAMSANRKMKAAAKALFDSGRITRDELHSIIYHDDEGGGAANGGESQALQAAILGLHTLAGEFPTPTWKTREDYLQATISEINEILGKQ